VNRDEQGARSPAAFRMIGVMTLWDAAQAEQMLVFLDELRNEIWQVHGEQIRRARHEEAVQASLDLDDETPF